MRLGQLSRKIAVKSDDIVKVLKKHFREVNNHPNIKIHDEELDFLLDHFKKDETQVVSDKTPQVLEDNIEKKQDTEDHVIPKESEAQAEVSVDASDTTKQEFIETLKPKVITLENEFSERTSDLESFRVEKPELEGLKVLGKIDLPEPKPKTDKKKESTREREKDDTINERGAKRRYQKDSRQQGKRDRRTPAEQRKREEYLAKKQREAEEKKLKALKKKHYEKNVKAKIEAKPKKKRKKKYVTPQEKQVSSKTHPPKRSVSKNPLAKFWKWLNGDYDQFD